MVRLHTPLPRRFALQLPLALLPLYGSPQPSKASGVRDGMSAFADNRVEESIRLYDEIIAQQPQSKPFLWQRGLSLYYADRFADGADQFATDVAVNPNDTEEQIWHLLCLAEKGKVGLEAARPRALTVGTDRRPVMRAAQALFLGKSDAAPLEQYAAGSSASDEFYSNLYLGLYAEATSAAAEARTRITQAAEGRYAAASNDPMADLAKVHVKRRGWGGGRRDEL